MPLTAHVSIVVPCFNRAALIGETLDSVAAQTDSRWECIVVDDGSTDASLDIVGGYVSRDARFRLLKRDQAPKGASTCRNIGTRAARGDYVIFLDSDDLLEPDRVEATLELGEKHPDADALIFQCRVLYEGNAQIPAKRMREYWNRFGADDDHLARFLIYDIPWISTSPSWRRSYFMETVGGWNVAVPRSQDWELHIRALSLGMRCACFPERVGFTYRCHDRMTRITDRNLWTAGVVAYYAAIEAVRRSPRFQEGLIQQALTEGTWIFARQLQQMGYPWKALGLLFRAARVCGRTRVRALLLMALVVVSSVASKVSNMAQARRSAELKDLVRNRSI